VIPHPASPVTRPAWRAGRWEEGARQIAEETAVALTYNRATHAVMMATPADLEDFAVGFSLAEGVVERADEIEEVEIVAAGSGDGVEARMWIAPGRVEALGARRRAMAGPTGCGLCGLDSLAQALRPPPRVACALRVTPGEIEAAVSALAPAQPLGRATRAVHAAGFWQPGRGLVAIREDVGRHNALDKLTGALARAGESAAAGVVVMTSRVSVELVQKAARMGAGVLVAVSAPTGLALRAAEAAGITLAAVAREDGFELFTHPERIGEIEGEPKGERRDDAA
jgi:FdhD protein